MDSFKTQQAVWCKTLLKIYSKIEKDLYDSSNKKLKTPTFDISSSGGKTLGFWNAEKRVIAISADIFLYYDKKAIDFILRHEVAHQIVNEIFNTHGKPHGELLKKACKMIGADYHATVTKEELAQFASSNNRDDVSKIKKILAKANCEGASEKEAESFLKKAQSLMIKYNLEHKDLDDHKKLFLPRPVGKLFKSTPAYYYEITAILRKHYFVKAIRCSTFVKDLYGQWRMNGIPGNNMKYFELFGETSNLDIAEYIFLSLEREGESLWEEFKKEKKAMGVSIKGIFSKKAFLTGVYRGFSDKLDVSKEAVMENIKKETKHSTSLISLNDPLLEEKYAEEYPSISNIKSRGSSLGGYNSGFSQGQNLKISQGVTSSNSNGPKYLN